MSDKEQKTGGNKPKPPDTSQKETREKTGAKKRTSS
jgi:hypothetical protein